MKKILFIVGSLNMDLVVRTKQLPKPGQTILASEFLTVPGGKGANQAVAAARLASSTRVMMVGRVGADPYGTLLVENLKANEVETEGIVRDGNSSTGIALITVEDSGENTIVVYPGANWQLKLEDFRAFESVLPFAGAIVVQLEIPISTVEAVIDSAYSRGVRVILNPAPARTLPTSLLQKVDFLIPNETEAEAISGISINGVAENAVIAAETILRMGPKTVIITLGARGAILATAKEIVHFPSYVVKAKDVTAAGDAFVGGFAVRLLETESLHSAIDWGCRAGALAVSRPGAQTSLPRRLEVENLSVGLRQHLS